MHEMFFTKIAQVCKKNKKMPIIAEKMKL